MPKIDMIAAKNFTYGTRRLMAEEPFTARNRSDAVILAEILGKAIYGRPPGAVAAPPRELMERAREAVTPPPPVAEALPPKPEEPASPKARALSQLDHDGDGRAGGSKKGRTVRRRAKARK